MLSVGKNSSSGLAIFCFLCLRGRLVDRSGTASACRVGGD
jgi:hypothetical protein